jgi:signal transduction histidine kinase
MKIEAISIGTTRPADSSSTDSTPGGSITAAGAERRTEPNARAPRWNRRPVAPEALVEAIKAQSHLAIFLVEVQGDGDALCELLQAANDAINEPFGAYVVVMGVRRDEDLALRLYQAGADEIHFSALSDDFLAARFAAITRRFREVEDIQRVRRRLEEAQEIGNLGNWHYNIATDRSWWSPQLYRIFERDPSLGPMSFEEQFEFIHPDDGVKLRESVQRAIQFREEFTAYCRILLRDGTTRMVHGRGRPIVVDGKVVALEGVIQNIEERRQVEGKLRRHEQILGYISEYLPAALYQFRQKYDGSRWLEYISLGSLPNFDSLKAHVGKRITTPPIRVLEEDVPALMSSGGEAAAKLEPWVDEFRVYDDNGEIRWIAGRSTPEEVDDGSIVWRGIMIDITERKLLTEQVQRADRLATIGTMAAGIAHEVNNPLVFVLGNLQLGLEELGEGENAAPIDTVGEANELRRALTSAFDGARRIKVVVEDLMSFGRANQARDEQVDLRRTCQSATRMLVNQIRATAQLECELDEVPEVRGNPGQLRQVLVNLLLNAAQAMPEGRRTGNRILLRLFETEDHVCVEVNDNGKGIREADKKQLFDPFFSTKPAGEGAGLGLYVCRNIIESMGGAIEVDSTPGEGSAFRLRFKKSRK